MVYVLLYLILQLTDIELLDGGGGGFDGDGDGD
jgi:hypothetical protein